MSRVSVLGVASLLAAPPGPGSPSVAASSAIIVGLFAGDNGVEAGEGALILRTATGVDAEALARAMPGFGGAPGERAHAVVPSGATARPVVLVGLGSRARLDASVLRNAALVCSAWRDDAGRPADTLSLLALELPGGPGVAGVVEGHSIGEWRYRRPSEAATQLTVLVTDAELAPCETAVERATLIARATNWVRQLVETPSNLLGPAEFAAAVRGLADELAPGLIRVTQWSDTDLAERNFGGTLGVGAGSTRAPRAVLLEGGGDGGQVALTGKGITFDSGGINLKRDLGELAWMKSDMAAAASVAGAAIVSVALGSDRSIRALLPIAENMASGSAQRPGDVVRHPDGRTTEVTDTDCEGRLVLADAVAWLAAGEPELVIDVGTLTDSGGLGTAYWGCWSTAPGRAADLVAAGERAGDPGWFLPLHDSYTRLLDSRVADIANASLEAPDSGQLAATYLRTFAHDVPWIHIDNGSGAWLERDSGVWQAGPTGTPLRALVEFLVPAP